MAKICYASVHSILEQEELQLFTELGHDCFSLGAYTRPEGHYLLPRPAVTGMKYHPDLEEMSLKYARTSLPKEFFDNFDIIINMHSPEFITENWERMRHKKVVWRTIGQSVKDVENMVRKMRYEGLNIVRYSPMEQNIEGYLGADAIIRFYKDPTEYFDWNGKEKRVINVTQSLRGRGRLCHYDEVLQIFSGFPALVYGPGNEDLGPLNGGCLPFNLLKGALRDNRCFLYTGTWPASYTLGLIEALMTGIPVVALGQKLAEEVRDMPQAERWHFYEITNIIKNGENGFVSDSIPELRTTIHELLQNDGLAERISREGRKTAIDIFSKETIKKQWEMFFKELSFK